MIHRVFIGILVFASAAIVGCDKNTASSSATTQPAALGESLYHRYVPGQPRRAMARADERRHQGRSRQASQPQCHLQRCRPRFAQAALAGRGIHQPGRRPAHHQPQRSPAADRSRRRRDGRAHSRHRPRPPSHRRQVHDVHRRRQQEDRKGRRANGSRKPSTARATSSNSRGS